MGDDDDGDDDDDDDDANKKDLLEEPLRLDARDNCDCGCGREYGDKVVTTTTAATR